MHTDHTSYERYQRQVMLKGFGEAGQQKLLRSKVLVIGAGGLGCPALQYLVAAGVGHIGIVDDDVVSITNLHRQVLYNTFDIGFPKADIAKHSLARLNPDIHITAFNERLSVSNALSIISGYDIILDGTDNFATRYMINDACVLLGKPLVFGAISQFEGQVAIFNQQSATGEQPVNYRDLFPDPPKDGEVLNCAEAGVLGILPGIIGTMMANETIKLITGIGTSLVNALLNYNALHNSIYEVSLTARPETPGLIPTSKEAFEKMDYEWLCAAPASPFEINGATFNELITNENVAIIDVREPHETPAPTAFQYIQVPLSQFREHIPSIESDAVILFCQSGKRSLQAAQWLFDTFGETKKIYSLQGGILNWLKNNSTPTP